MSWGCHTLTGIWVHPDPPYRDIAESVAFMVPSQLPAAALDVMVRIHRSACAVDWQWDLEDGRLDWIVSVHPDVWMWLPDQIVKGCALAVEVEKP